MTCNPGDPVRTPATREAIRILPLVLSYGASIICAETAVNSKNHSSSLAQDVLV
jgi:hypothetical protein